MSKKYMQAWQISADDFQDLPDLSEKIAFLLQYAILAPSPWNSQPWKFKIADNRLELYEVPERWQRHRDPESREQLIACGAALANTSIAATHFGIHSVMQICPPQAPEHCIATMSFTPKEPEETALATDSTSLEDELNERLFQAITKRHCFRQDFLDRPVHDSIREALERISASCDVDFVPLPSFSTKLALAGIIAEGDRHLESDEDIRNEYASWIRRNEKKGDGVPGYALGMGTLASMLAPVTHKIFNYTDEHARKDSKLASSTALIGVFMSHEDNRGGWMQCGVALQNVLLLAASHGIQASFLNQPIPVPELRERLSALLGRQDVPQTIIRLGYPDTEDIKPTPRLPLEEVLID